MKILLKRAIGLILLLLAFMGIGMCIAGSFFVIRAKLLIIDRSVSALSLVLKTIDVTEEGLISASQATDSAIESMNNLEDSLKTTNSTLNNSLHFFDTAIILSGKTLPDTITATREALDSAATSARLIDDTLSLIAAIPLIGKQYNLEKPMSQALTEVSISLSNLPDTFKGVEDDFVEIKQNMSEMQTQLTKAQTQMEKIHDSLDTAKKVISQYHEMLLELKPYFRDMKELLPKWLNGLVVGMLIFFGWFALSQLGLIVQGVILLTSSKTN